MEKMCKNVAHVMPVKRKKHSGEKNKESKTGRSLRGGGGSDVCHSGEEFVKEQETYSSIDNLSRKVFYLVVDWPM
ncbi:hypothetical protein PIB30_018250 [Stylosanthes scabra]|uniref:Uncharacterized protein n=1 Tax=Stylosanthes scabra TaxID=79078 RepID=A0ABU6W7D8_9FABA|nr:hypothetical protein [Stylosanthes scabra]